MKSRGPGSTWGPTAPYGSEESHRRYARFIAEWEASGGQLPPGGDDLTVEEVAARFLLWLDGYFKDSLEPQNYRTAIRRVLTLYGDIEANEFGPRCMPTPPGSWASVAPG